MHHPLVVAATVSLLLAGTSVALRRSSERMHVERNLRHISLAIEMYRSDQRHRGAGPRFLTGAEDIRKYCPPADSLRGSRLRSEEHHKVHRLQQWLSPVLGLVSFGSTLAGISLLHRRRRVRTMPVLLPAVSAGLLTYLVLPPVLRLFLPLSPEPSPHEYLAEFEFAEGLPCTDPAQSAQAIPPLIVWERPDLRPAAAEVGVLRLERGVEWIKREELEAELTARERLN